MNDFDHQKLLDQLIRHEGIRLRPYRDARGRLAIGVGRALEDVGLTRSEAVTLLAGDVQRVKTELEKRLPFFNNLDAVRQRVLIDIAFASGTMALLKLRPLLTALHAGDWDWAANEIRDAQWAAVVPARIIELAEMMRSGCDEPVNETQARSA